MEQKLLLSSLPAEDKRRREDKGVKRVEGEGEGGGI